jgi:hypothetical protein
MEEDRIEMLLGREFSWASGVTSPSNPGQHIVAHPDRQIAPMPSARRFSQKRKSARTGDKQNGVAIADTI